MVYLIHSYIHSSILSRCRAGEAPTRTTPLRAPRRESKHIGTGPSPRPSSPGAPPLRRALVGPIHIAHHIPSDGVTSALSLCSHDGGLTASPANHRMHDASVGSAARCSQRAPQPDEQPTNARRGPNPGYVWRWWCAYPRLCGAGGVLPCDSTVASPSPKDTQHTPKKWPDADHGTKSAPTAFLRLSTIVCTVHTHSYIRRD